ncbi:discoidin domain-containing protein [Deinococcus peraridilitoris]|uniref:F5/8 type C domain-containing protein n=1 Tax=Deinococcus peraridilitoris (strain DSM 19664 / LMG 22246 / CIP 109416 / KR-200) TaxID=937777 RepID=L0A224_DEIPD|nr:discoidin domain-containing protein [Deinococcus peraridilitoris]AFZ67055.1 F5/8 type C domain-containing protein [Deinococcus peraridilitoris DSM 19664]
MHRLFPLLVLTGSLALAAPLTIRGVTASAQKSTNPASAAIDRNLNTWWSADWTPGQPYHTFTVEVPANSVVRRLNVAFYAGDARRAAFLVETSSDGTTWRQVLPLGISSGLSRELQPFDLTPSTARFVRVTSFGNTQNTASAITEVTVEGDAPVVVQPAQVTPAWYVDAVSGNDTNPGTQARPWKSLARASREVLPPGATLRLRKGQVFKEVLNATWKGTREKPIVISAYGTNGDSPLVKGSSNGPVVQIRGEWLIFEHLQVSADLPSSWKAKNPSFSGTLRCPNQPQGWTTGFTFTASARNNVVRQSTAYGMTAGVHFQEGSEHNEVRDSRLVKNTVISTNTPASVKYDDDSGAWGVLLNGKNNRVINNYFSGNSGCSEDYGVEGASFELYKTSGNLILENTLVDETTMAELGGTPTCRSENNTFAFNAYSTRVGGQTLIVRGHGAKWGGNPGTRFYNNTAWGVRDGILCSDGCSPEILSARNNIIVQQQSLNDRNHALWTDGTFDDGHNLFWRVGGNPSVRYTNGATRPTTNRTVDPRLVNPGANDLRLSAGSPAVWTGTGAPLRLLGLPVIEGRVHIGAQDVAR